MDFSNHGQMMIPNNILNQKGIQDLSMIYAKVKKSSISVALIFPNNLIIKLFIRFQYQ